MWSPIVLGILVGVFFSPGKKGLYVFGEGGGVGFGLD